MSNGSVRILAVAMAAVLLSAMAISAWPKVFAASQSKTADNHNNDTSKTVSEKPHLTSVKITNLRIALRDLWVDHVVWTRLYIISAVSGAPDINFAAERLLKNQEDIGNAIKPFYGDAAGDKLTSLLKDHILIAFDLLKAAKAGDSAGEQAAGQKWYKNADDIATFLSDANPNWSKKDLLDMLNSHLALTKVEAVARLTGDYEKDIATFEQIKKEAMSMADHMAYGIVKQAKSAQ